MVNIGSFFRKITDRGCYVDKTDIYSTIVFYAYPL